MSDMANGVGGLHSHSALERELCMEKSKVLVDERYADLFPECAEPFSYHNVRYVKVPILAFVSRGGAFKNLIK